MKIGQLEWVQNIKPNMAANGEEIARGFSCVRIYKITYREFSDKHFHVTYDNAHVALTNTIEEAKQAAQRDFEHAIKSCII